MNTVSSLTIAADRFEPVAKHHRRAFTQGLEVVDLCGRDWLLETSGAPHSTSRSSLIVYSLDVEKTAKQQIRPVSEIEIPGIFLEGVAQVDDSLLLITWKDQLLVHMKMSCSADQTPQFEVTNTFGLPYEGWGLAFDTRRKELYMTTGGSDLIVLELPPQWDSMTPEQTPTVLGEKRRTTITQNAAPLKSVNELEYLHAQDLLIGNVFGSTDWVVISPTSGVVQRVVHFEHDHFFRERPRDPANDVMNGIAFWGREETFLFTGKRWDSIFGVSKDLILQ
ncbi:MAG: uncharacterized protein KVP18_002399 [Porospora cf. gigantea A]|uniref:uncharacterized protein n=1 Tax=Porospora cf. gigantea A TaxID=2853593 RepID=UPI00355AC05F|nr:MAG: hypothetical protein KVP18_002399 [Porospora cf. gigantea A]